MSHLSTSKLDRQRRRDDAAARTSRSPEDQLAHLDALFGKGEGAVKERAKLQARIAARDSGETLLKEVFEKPKTPKKGRQPKGKKRHAAPSDQ